MSLDLNFIFHKDIIEDSFVGLRHNHTAYFYKWLQDYVSPVDPTFKPDIKYNVTYVESYNDVDVLSNCVNVIFVPMNYPLLRHMENKQPDMLDTLYRLDDKPNVKLVMDYNNETLLPGNFDPIGEDKINIVKNMDHSRFYCSTFGWHRENVKDVLPFKKIIGTISYIYYWYANALLETPWIADPNLIYTHPGKHSPIRYFVPSNMFRPNRAQCIIQMHHKNMLLDAEWNMNKFKDFFMFKEDLDNPYVIEYLEKFGSEPRLMSWPWKNTFNKKRVLEEKDYGVWEPDHFDSYNTFDTDLLSNVLIYIVQETFSTYKGEEPEDPTKPMFIMDITEKTFKSFVYGMPAFLNARNGSVQSLEQEGFDMLTDYSKYDYDSEPDLTKRLDLMLESAKEFPTPDREIVGRLRYNKNKIVSKEYAWNGQKEFMKIMLDKK